MNLNRKIGSDYTDAFDKKRERSYKVGVWFLQKGGVLAEPHHRRLEVIYF